MHIAFGADDDNETVKAVLTELQGTASQVDVKSGDDTDWPEFARAVGEAVASGEADFGVVMCWTGTGTAIAANKVEGVHAATAWEPWIAGNARAWNDANVLALSSKRTAPEVAVECVRSFLTTGVDPDEVPTIAKLQ